MKLNYFCIAILLLTSCLNKHTSNPCETIENADFENYPVFYLKGEELPFNDSTLLEPQKLWIQDSLLVIFDAAVEDHKFLRFYSLNTLQLLYSFGTIGRGPEEYLYPNVFWNTEKTFLLTERLKFTILHTDSLLNQPVYHPVKHSVPSGLVTVTDVYVLNASLLLIHTGMTDEQFSIYNSLNGNYVTKYTNYPTVVSAYQLNDFICNSNVYSGIYLLKPNTLDTLAIIYRHFPVIDLVAMKDLSTKRIQFPIDNQINQVTILDSLNARLENRRELYTQYYYTEKYFYLLYNNLPKENIRYNQSFEIHRFDWQGNLIARFKPDRIIYKFCVDEKNSKIYATCLDDDADYSIKIISFSLTTI